MTLARPSMGFCGGLSEREGHCKRDTRYLRENAPWLEHFSVMGCRPRVSGKMDTLGGEFLGAIIWQRPDAYTMRGEPLSKQVKPGG